MASLVSAVFTFFYTRCGYVNVSEPVAEPTETKVEPTSIEEKDESIEEKAEPVVESAPIETNVPSTVIEPASKVEQDPTETNDESVVEQDPTETNIESTTEPVIEPETIDESVVESPTEK